jgi:GH24 family phage-related lysozyme (muramidase)
VPPYLDKSIMQLKEFEGCVSWMYRDTAGKVTVGVGLMLPDAAAACALPFLEEGSAAAAGQITREFTRVAALSPGKLPHFYREPGSPELAQEFMDAKLRSVLEEFEVALRAKLSGYDSMPDEVKIALLDMAYNLGPTGLLKGYPHMLGAVETGLWAEAAADCSREGISEARNAWTRQQFLAGVVATIRAEVGARVAAEVDAIEGAPEGGLRRISRGLRRLMKPGR